MHWAVHRSTVPLHRVPPTRYCARSVIGDRLWLEVHTLLGLSPRPIADQHQRAITTLTASPVPSPFPIRGRTVSTRHQVDQDRRSR